MFGIGLGTSGDEKSQFNKLNAGSDFATNMGQGNITASSDFMRSVLSGDPTKIATALSPQIRGVQDRTQQAENKVAQFNTRSGGNTATVAGLDATGRGDVTSLVGSETGNAVSGLASTGDSLVKTGIAGNEAGFDEAKAMQAEHEAKINDIIKGITSVAAAPFTGGTSLNGIIPGMGGSVPGANPAPGSMSWMLGPHS